MAIPDDNYLHEIVEQQFKSVHKLHKKYSDCTSVIFSTIKSKLSDTKILNVKYVPELYDCMILGGGLKGLYVYGSLILLKKLIDENKIRIGKFIGVSVGAFLAVFILSGLDIEIIRNINDFGLDNNDIFSIDHILIKCCWELLPENIHELVNGKISIIVSKSVFSSNRETHITHFESKKHLIQVLHASSHIPFLTTRQYNGVYIKGEKYYDGAFSNPCPSKMSGNNLVFYTCDVDYPNGNAFRFNDRCPELIIFKGLIEFEKYILNVVNKCPELNEKFPIKWFGLKVLSKTKSHSSKSVMGMEINENGLRSSAKKNKHVSFVQKISNSIKRFFSNTSFKNSTNQVMLLFFLSVCELISIMNLKKIAGTK